MSQPEMIGEYVFATGPQKGQAERRTFKWTNTKGFTMRIFHVTLWIGATYGAKMDTHSVLLTPRGVLAEYAQDYYAKPNGPHQISQSLLPYGALLHPGEELTLLTYASPNGGKQADYNAVIWWAKEE
jgi:hypothetical protein